MSVLICMISDTHCQHKKVVVPKCDILVHAGDWSHEGKKDQVEDFAKWLDEQDADEIILIAGNHERVFQRALPESLNWIKDHCPRANVLIESGIEVAGIKFWGSAYTPAYGFNWAWNAGRTLTEAAHIHKPFIGDIWAKIPEETNFLVTHGMPFAILDSAYDYQMGKMICVGDTELRKKCESLSNLKYVVGGHLHHNGGKSIEISGVTYVNAAQCDDNYTLNRKPVLIKY